MEQREIGDRIEIEARLNDYASAVDRQDWNLYRSVFTADAHVDYVSAGGIAGSVDEVADWLGETMPIFACAMHLISNVRITFSDDDHANVEAMFHNPMLFAGDGSFQTGGWYHHEMVRTRNGWRSAKLTEECSYFSGLDDSRVVDSQ